MFHNNKMYRKKKSKQKYISTIPEPNDSPKKFPTLLLLIILLIIIAVGVVLYKAIGTPSRVQSNFGYKFY